ncbi:PREDICTED: uncharacterized protein LOC108750860 [Trachymyrmex septentrionalis]|uniref:uncharacterized protein LOC108750860 n=1 Tax=Trachymyrmex septentrionalis TaxID=34720 RepID=UPI00084F4DC2|nr:PREDICTED: uncharacterized protein LOC108750860 [Trachymyrmex septentrionalis]
MAAQTVAAAFIDGCVARFGISVVITTDQSKQFGASLFQALSKFLDSKKTRTSLYHSGLIERWHCTLKTSITCHEDGRQWLDLLPTVLLRLLTCLKEDLKCFPAELVYGAPLRVPGEFLENLDPTEDTETFVIALRKRIQLRPQLKQHHGKRTAFRQQQLEQATHVFVREDSIRKSLQHPYTGPHKVICRENEQIYVIHINGRDVVLLTERLKPAFLPNANEVSELP